MDTSSSMTPPSTILSPFFGRSKILLAITLLILFGVGLGLRLVDLTDEPLDFHPWRQLRAASITRGMYFTMLPDTNPELRSSAISLGKQFQTLEPKIFETLVAYTYRLIGGEHLWIARLYAITFWMIGGIALYTLARRLTSDDGAIVSLAFYLIVPFGFTGSRAFLPEPLMVMWIMLAAYSFYQWAEEHTWRWAILSGLTSGIAILVKVFAIFPLATA
ncbi:MAG: phospholipid carrier-dependent glycosyltransferase, partial [Anaerolineales bacterium]|nr:phospholipid carrier-dependent glycosyltransferase [Anaerolineales bacterium]